jgi:hypothetical protein
MAKWGKIGAPKSAKRKAWLATLRGKKKGTKRVRSPRRVTTRRKTTVARKKKSYRRKKTVPLAAVLGIAAPIMNEVLWHWRQGEIDAIPKEIARILTGYDMQTGKWDFGSLLQFWLPAGAGFAMHKVASMLGINRMLARAGIPYLRI